MVLLGPDCPAGVHYRSDGGLSLVLGEDLAISVMRDRVDAFNRFDGTPVTIRKPSNRDGGYR
jgi:hypothetical protein